MNEEDSAKMHSLSQLLGFSVEQARQTGTLPIILGAMAHALQQALWRPDSPIRHSDALEDIMRAVAATIENDPKSEKYIMDKMTCGFSELAKRLSADVSHGLERAERAMSHGAHRQH